MSWVDCLDRNVFLRSLYATDDPALRSVRIHELRLHQDGPSLAVRFDLLEFPQNPPLKWRGSNTAQVTIGMTVESITLADWSTDNIVDINLEVIPNGRLRFSARRPSGLLMSCSATYGWVVEVGHYCRTV